MCCSMKRGHWTGGATAMTLALLAACSPNESGGMVPLDSDAVGGSGGSSDASVPTGSMPPRMGEGGGPSQTSRPSDAGVQPGHGAADAAPPTPNDASAPISRDGGTSGSDGGAGGVPLDPAVARRLAALSSRLAPLAARTASFWFEHGPDTAFGGFHGTLDRQGNPASPDDKGLIQETRHLWMLSTWYERREDSRAVAELARETYEFIRESFVDVADGAFVYKVSRDGNRVVDARKQLFAESYAIYALATYGRVFDVEEAIELSLSRFSSIDASRHDAVFGGYDQRGDPGSLSAGAEKDTNTHLHLLEAFTALYEATAAPRVAARLNELIDLFATRLLRPVGYVHSEFELDWTPFGAPRVSYGHDLETAWLLLEAARVVGRANDPSVRSAARAMAEHSAGLGQDATNGGYFEAGTPNGPTNDFDKIWWVQFEAMAGLWWAYELSSDPLQLDRLTSTLDWIELTEDLPAGEWFAASNAQGGPAGPDYKGDEWKASYHSVRALVFVQDWMDDELAPRRAR